MVTVALKAHQPTQADLPKVGFVVSKRVGNSVVRHQVARRLRHVLRPMLPALAGSSVVVLAKPSAAQASSAELSLAVTTAFKKLGIDVSEGQ